MGLKNQYAFPIALRFAYAITCQNPILHVHGSAIDPGAFAQVGIVIVISLNALAIGISLLALVLQSFIRLKRHLNPKP